MKFLCPLSGKRWSVPYFNNLEIPEESRIHPAVVSLTKNNRIFRQGVWATTKFLQTISPDELIFGTAALLSLTPNIEFHNPISPVISVLRNEFPRLYFACSFVKSYERKSNLPGYSINQQSCDLLGLLGGWLEEVEDEKKKIRRRYREEILDRMQERHERKLRNRLLAGKTLFHHLIDPKTFIYLMECMGIPSDDFPYYQAVMYGDIWENLRTNGCAQRLLEFESYLDHWYSLSNYKLILQRHVSYQIGEFLDMGGHLPADYYTEDEHGNIESLKYGHLESFHKVIKPKLVFNLKPSTIKPTAEPKPTREQFPTIREYAIALSNWARKNEIR